MQTFLVKIIFSILTISFLFGGGFLVFGQSVKDKTEQLKEQNDKLEDIIENKESATAYKDLGNFIIYYNRQTEKEAKLATSLVASTKEEFCKLLDCQVSDLRVYVYILPGRKEFEKKHLEIAGRQADEHLLAFSYLERDIINGILKVKNNTVKIYIYFSNDLSSIKRSFVHEFSHALINQWLAGSNAKKSLPMGIEEGVVQLLDGQFLESSYQFNTQANQFIPLTSFLIYDEEALRSQPQISKFISEVGGHQQAASLVYYLLTRPNAIEKLRFLTKNYVAKASNEEVLDLIKQVFSCQSIEQLEKNWLEWNKNRPRDIRSYVNEARQLLPPEIWKFIQENYK